VAIRTALGAAVGARTVKSGQSRWFVGYKKHTLRLWVGETIGPILLAPLISWAAPGNRCDVLFLEPSLRYCHHQLGFVPDLVVGDLAYINVKVQRRLREQFHVGIVTPLKRDFELSKAAETGLTFRCRQGQKLEWLGLNDAEQLHWFAVRDPHPICNWCWEQGACPREFAFAPSDHETVFGTVPVQSIAAQKLLGQVRKWIEASQSYEKNQLGLTSLFLNSLRLTWIFALLADTVCLLRCKASLVLPSNRPMLFELFPAQMQLDL
jgi:hypothetical protein